MVRRKTAAGKVARLALLVGIAAFSPDGRAEEAKPSQSPPRGTSTKPKKKKKVRKVRPPAPDAPLAPTRAGASAAACNDASLGANEAGRV
jgi:hypothetical protein